MTSDRKDFVGFLSEELAELGLCKGGELGTTAGSWDMYIGEQFEDGEVARYVSEDIRDGSVVQSIPGLRKTLGVKSAFADLYTSCLSFSFNHACGVLYSPKDGHKTRAPLFLRTETERARCSLLSSRIFSLEV